MFEEEYVISGVPQGTVLAEILFVIMISDIDENVKRSIVRSLTDSTRTNKKMNNPNDIKEMQEDLDTIYKWAIKNKMAFNKDKITPPLTCQMSYINT